MILALDRAGNGLLYSGYCSVTGLRKRCLKVVAKPEMNPLNDSLNTQVSSYDFTIKMIAPVTMMFRRATGISTFHPRDIS
jgi:hypothetical protein